MGGADAAAHIRLGGGNHARIGAPLARVELETALHALVERAPNLELVAEPERVPAIRHPRLPGRRVDVG